MKRLLLTAVLAVGAASPAAAQDVFGTLGVLDTGVANLYATSVTLVRGDVTATTDNLANTVNGLTTGLADGTPAEPLAEQGVELSNTLVDQSEPVTDLLTEQGEPVAELLQPLADAYISNAGGALRDGIPLSDGLVALGTADGGFQDLLGNAGILGLSDLIELLPAIPVFDGSSSGLSAGALPLPLDALDTDTLTGLLDGSSLPGLDGLGGLDGADGLVALLDPSALTGLLGGGLPGAGTLPGFGALPLDLLDPSILTGLLSGGLPALPSS